MRHVLKLVVLFSAVGTAAVAQVQPAAVGPGLTVTPAHPVYALRYSQTVQAGNGTPTLQTSTLSGDLSYLNQSDRRPFQVDYSGGYTWTLSGPSYQNGLFQHLYLSQGFDWRKVKINFNDNVSYLPQAPTTGFSGIPGIGEPIGTPNPGPTSSQLILTQNTHVVDNSADGSFETLIGKSTAVSAEGRYELLRYTDANALDTDTFTGRGELNERLTGRTSVFGRYSYTQFSYPDYSITIQTTAAQAGIEHRWTRNLTTSFDAGPEWISSNDSGLVPSSNTIAADATVSYLHRLSSFSASYNRGVNGGSGYLYGGMYDNVNGTFTHEFEPSLTLGLSGGYQRTDTLNTNGAITAEFGGVQATYRVNDSLIVFANYTGTNQTSSAIQLPSNVITALQNTFGFGIGYQPREAHPRQ
jgi:hypothetical protein